MTFVETAQRRTQNTPEHSPEDSQLTFEAVMAGHAWLHSSCVRAVANKRPYLLSASVKSEGAKTAPKLSDDSYHNA